MQNKIRTKEQSKKGNNEKNFCESKLKEQEYNCKNVKQTILLVTLLDVNRKLFNLMGTLC